MKYRFLSLACASVSALWGLAQGAQPASNFGNNGLATLNYINQPYDLILTDTDPTPDGGLLICGTHLIGDGGRMFAQRFGATGHVLQAFGTSGKFISPETLGSLGCHQAAVRPDGSVMLLGSRNQPGAYFMDVIQLTPAGDVDTQFGENGISSIQLSSNLLVHDVVLDPSGIAFISGSISGFACVLRMLPNGTLDMQFGEAGLALIGSPLGFPLAGLNIELAPSGYLVVSGPRDVVPCLASYVAALDLQGQPVSWFGLNGFQELDLYENGVEILLNMELLTDGSILLSGTRYGNAIPNQDIYVMLEADGSRKAGFGQQGIVEWIYETGTTHHYHQPHLLPDGDLLFAGVQTSTNGLLCKLYLHRLNPDGTTETDFGTDGTFYYQPNGGSFDASPLWGSMLADGRIAIAAPRYGASGPAHAVQVFQLNEITTALEEPAAQHPGITAFPNPTTGQVTLSNWPVSDDRTVRILDVNGRLVQQWNTPTPGTNTDLKMELEPTLANGRYFVMGAGADHSTSVPVELVR